MALSLDRTRNDIYERRAQIKYSASLDIQGVNISSTSYDAWSNNGVINYTFNNGVLSISGLSKGVFYQIDASVTYNYWWSELTGYINGIPQYVTKTGSQTYSASIDIYTHPGELDMGAVTGETIANVLDSEVINGKWIPHFQAAYHWYNQKNVDYGPANEIYPRSKDGMQVISGEPIYAEWFNNCMEGMRQFDKDVDDVRKDDLITAILINQMNFTGKS